ncbi:MAG: hypothetical protein KGL39_32890 [Patescibacteria group bacterium]|nr:hypothetical protein [Patescibacteria group bacterium]
MRKTFIAALLILGFAIAPTVYALSPLQAWQGGTGTSTTPSAGQVLVGQQNGTYAPQATSSLGITGGSGTTTGITSVTSNYPLTGAGTSTSPLSMPTSTAAIDGFLAHGDFSTFNGKQSALISGTNIKTVGGNSLLGSGDVGTIDLAHGGTATTTFANSGIVFSDSSKLTQDMVGSFCWDSANHRLGIGTCSPAELLNVAAPSGSFGTIRFDSGATHGYFFAYDGSPEISIGSQSNAQLNFKVNNSTEASLLTGQGGLQIQGSTGDHSFLKVVAPTTNQNEATMSTILDHGSGNREFVDWTSENYGTDWQHSINVSKAGSGSLLPLSVRFWNSDLGNIAANGYYSQTWLPNGTIGFGVSTSTAGVSGLKSLLYGASSTADYLLKLDTTAGTNKFNVASSGVTTMINASTTNVSASNAVCIGSDCRTVWPSGAVSSVSSSDGTLTVSPTTGSVVASLALGHGNTWTALQQFAQASSSQATTTALWVPTTASALWLSDSAGKAGAYAGTSCTNQFVRSVNGAGVATCSTVGAGDVSLANLTATDSTLTFSGTYNGSIARTIGLNLGNANTWTATQSFFTASSSQATTTNAWNTNLTVSGNTNIGNATSTGTVNTATSTINGNLVIPTRNFGGSWGSSTPSIYNTISRTATTTGFGLPMTTAATFQSVACFTDTGTTSVAWFDGATMMVPSFVVGPNSATTFVTFTSSNTASKGDTPAPQYLSTAGTPHMINCSVKAQPTSL